MDKVRGLETVAWTGEGVMETSGIIHTHMGIGQEPGLEGADFESAGERERVNHRCWALDCTWSPFIKVAGK